jgi:dinuclear metal center YbgI/SA1388 family protein
MSERSTVELDQLVHYLDRLLDASRGNDVCANGLQVEGTRPIRRLVTGVSACRELFVEARQREADAVLVHHGIFWRGDVPTLTGVQYRRVAELVHGGIGLLAYHLPLDRHPELGNNAVAARALGLDELAPFGALDGEEWGFRGRFAEPLEMDELSRRCRELFGQEPLVFAHGPAEITAVGMVSGGAQRVLSQAIGNGLDAFITGEVSEWVMNLSREAGIHFIAAGHYATERLGVLALGEHLAEHLGLEVEFVDIPNPV